MFDGGSVDVFCSKQKTLGVAKGFHYYRHRFSIRVLPMRRRWRQSSSPLDVIDCITRQNLLPGSPQSAKCFDKWWDWVGGMSHWWTDVKSVHQWLRAERENETLLIAVFLQFVLTCKVFPDYFKVWVEINELIVYQESIHLKESEIAKAIFWLCSKASCVMHLAMTTKLMVLCISPNRLGVGQTHESKAILGA